MYVKMRDSCDTFDGSRQDFLDANAEEIIILYLDTKFFPSPENAAQGYDDMVGVFGDAIWPVRVVRGSSGKEGRSKKGRRRAWQRLLRKHVLLACRNAVRKEAVLRLIARKEAPGS